MTHKKSNVNQLPVNYSNHPIRFSFEYYDGTRYCLSRWSQQQINSALLRLAEINKKSFNEMRQQSIVMHFGDVRWEKTIEPQGFPKSGKDNAFHFALLNVNGQKARVYGQYFNGVFLYYLV